MTTFDEAARLSLYSEAQLDALALRATALPEPSEAEPASVLMSAFTLAGGRDQITRAMVADIVTYLPGDLLVKVDLASMAHSLECRGPFLDHRVVELAVGMALDRKIGAGSGRSKIVLKRAFSDLLPAAIKARRKMGFGVPISRWFRKELTGELQSVLFDRVCLDRGLFRPEAIRALVDEHVSGRREHSYRLWALLVLELWFRTHIDAGPPLSEIPGSCVTSSRQMSSTG
jgi:asparagine synthase (glutamine-hydrolysing)